MGASTRTEIPVEVNNFYSRQLLDRSVPLFLHTMFGQVRDIPQNSGTDTIKFRKYGSLTAATTALTEGVTPVGSQLSTTDITATVVQYGDFVTITDKVLYETYDPILTETAEVLGEQFGNTIDQVCRDVLVAGSTVQYASSATTRGTVTSVMKLTRDEVREAVRTLKNNEAKPMTTRIDPSTGYNTAPLNRAYVSIIHPDTTHDLEDETGWIPVEKYPNKNDVMNGEVGSIANVRFVETTNAKIFSGEGASSIDVYATLILGQMAYGVTRISGKAVENIVKPLGSAGAADPLNQRTTSGWKATFVAKILQQTWMLRIEHAVSA